MNKKITDFSSNIITLGSILPIVDVSANETKNILLDTLRSWSSLSSGSVSLQGKSLILNNSNFGELGYCVQHGSPVISGGGGGYVPAITLSLNGSNNIIPITTFLPSKIQALYNSYSGHFGFTFIKIDYVIYSSNHDYSTPSGILEFGTAYINGDIAEGGVQTAEINVNKTVIDPVNNTGTWVANYNKLAPGSPLRINIPGNGSYNATYMKTFTTAL